MTLLEQEVFCECGSWRNFEELEDSISLDELIILYEAAMERQARFMKTVAAAVGAEITENDEPYQFLYSDSEKKQKSEQKSYQPAYAVDPSRGGEVTPLFGKEEAEMLPINLGYSIIDKQD